MCKNPFNPTPTGNNSSPADQRVDHDCVSFDRCVGEDDRVYYTGAVADGHIRADCDVGAYSCTWFYVGSSMDVNLADESLCVFRSLEFVRKVN